MPWPIPGSLNVEPERKTSKSNDVFGDFLESVSGVTSGPSADAQAAGSEPQPEASVAVENRPQESALGLVPILAYLRGHDGQSLPEVAAGLRSPILQTAEVINKLAASGVLELQGNPGDERIRLTETGMSLSSVA